MGVTPINNSIKTINQMGDIDEAAVAALERLLDQAKSGEVIGIAWAAMHADECTSFQCNGSSISRSLLGAITLLRAEIINEPL